MFTTQWPFRCAGCDETHPAGTNARYSLDNDLVAEDCRVAGTTTPIEDTIERAMPRNTSPADKCNRCFMVHSPGQDGCE